MTLSALLGAGLTSVEVVGPQRFEFPPGSGPGVSQRAELLAPLPAELLGLTGEVRAATGVEEQLRILCSGLHCLMPYTPSFPRGPELRLARKPLAAWSVLDRWRAGAHADPLSVAGVALQVAVEAGLDARLLVADDGSMLAADGFAGLEVWHPGQFSWIVLDPSAGLLFNRPDGFLSALALRRHLADEAEVGVTPMVARVAPSRFRSPILEYRWRLRNVWLKLQARAPPALRLEARGSRLEEGPASPVNSSRHAKGISDSGSAGPVGAPEPTWLLADATGARTWPWWLRSAGAKLDRRASALWTGPPSGLWAKLALCGLLLYALLLFATCPDRRPPQLASAALSDLRRVATTVAAGPLATRLINCFREPSRHAKILASLPAAYSLQPTASVRAKPALWEALRRLACQWLPRARLAVLREGDEATGGRLGPVRPWPFLALAAGALAIFSLQWLALSPICEEDAYISFRFARNLSTGQGFTFNPGEPGVEGFSNFLWILSLAAGYRWWPDLPHLALALGWLSSAAHLLLLAWMATRLGRLAWLPVLMLASNASFAGCAASGLETAQLCLLVTLAIWCWLREGPATSPWATAGACGLVAMSRPEGVMLFAAISAGREFTAAPGRWRVRWYLPFGLFLAAYTLLRAALFGAVIPHVYYGRLLAQHGPLLDRLGQGADYLASAFLANPVLLFGLLAAVSAWRGATGFRLATVALAHLGVVLAVGGDMDYFAYSRFLMPAAAPLALLAQLATQRWVAAGWRPPVVAGIALAVVLAGNSVASLRPQFVAALTAAPLARALAGGPAAFLDAIGAGAGHLRAGWFDGTKGSFDGQVARHLLAHLDPHDELVCPSAGRLAYLWPGPFRDHLGLVTPKPGPVAEPALTRGHRRWLLVFPHLLPPELFTLQGLDTRLAWAYVPVCQPRETHLPSYLLLAPPPRGVTPLTSGLFEPGWEDVRWPNLPRSQVVLCLENRYDVPVFDGVAGRQDARQFPLLPPPVRRWVEHPEWGK